MYLADALSDLCCDDCAQGAPCSSGLGFDIAPPDRLGLTLPGFVQDTLDFLPPSGMADGLDILNGVAVGLDFVPGVGPIASELVSTFGPALASIFQIGAGRHEADIITGPPNYVQNSVMNQITSISRTALNSSSIPQLQQFIQQLRNLRSAWLTFLGNTSHFHDGRASQQAANDTMPYLDGTCGYHWPPPLNPGQGAGCGGAWPTDFGYGAGLLGALERRLIDAGGQLPPPVITQGGSPFGPQLQFQTPGAPVIPQPGTLPPVSPIRTIPSGGVIPVSGGISTPMLAAGAVGLLLLSRLIP
jgi:hypothetical protein